MAIFAEAEMPEGEPNAKVEIAHVLTMDVVEYSKLLITEQVLGHAYGLKGDRAKALQLLEQLQDLERQNSVLNYSVALVYLALGDKNEALNRLEQSYRAGETGSISYIKVDPMLDPLRGDTRFEKLVDQVILPDAVP